MMFANRHYVLCARFAEQLSPGLRVKAFGFEHGDKILIAELALRTIGGDVVLKFGRALLVHVS